MLRVFYFYIFCQQRVGTVNSFLRDIKTGHIFPPFLRSILLSREKCVNCNITFENIMQMFFIFVVALQHLPPNVKKFVMYCNSILPPCLRCLVSSYRRLTRKIYSTPRNSDAKISVLSSARCLHP